jgi:xanthine/CO dehydrogenase XdhC/CoxF family maturation factor
MLLLAGGVAHETLHSRQTGYASVRFQGSRLELFAEYVAPPPALFVFGAGDDAQQNRVARK